MQNVLRVEDGKYLGGNVGDVEERLEAVESDVEQISSDLSELNSGKISRFEGTIDSKTCIKIDHLSYSSDGFLVIHTESGANRKIQTSPL